jgi:transposase
MEACLSAHFVSRMLRVLGQEPRIIPAIYVKPFVKGQKNDYNDAEAIAEAALRPNLRTVPRRHRIKATCKHTIESGPVWYLGERRRSTRFGRSSSNKESP